MWGLVIEGNRYWQVNLIYIIVERGHLFYVIDKFIVKSTKMPQVLIDLAFIKLKIVLSFTCVAYIERYVDNVSNIS